ncbi:MAG: carbohydrate deacetylase [Planctomycetota bacterium]
MEPNAQGQSDRFVKLIAHDVSDSKSKSPIGRRVVFHADDLGMNRAINKGVIEGFERGLLTSTSIIANAPDVEYALEQWLRLEQARKDGSLPSAELRRKLDDRNQRFDLGVHLNLSQGKPLTGSSYPYELLAPDGHFPGIMEVYTLFRHSLEPKMREPVERELRAQIQVLYERGIAPTHLNGHQYLEIMPAVTEIVPKLLEEYAIPVVRVAVERRLTRTTLLHGFQFQNWLIAQAKQIYARDFKSFMDVLSVKYPDAFYGTSHAGKVDLRLIQLFLRDENRFNLAEIGLHPAAPQASDDPPVADSTAWDDPLQDTRPNELSMLQSPELSDFLVREKLQLGRLSDLVVAEKPAAPKPPPPPPPPPRPSARLKKSE